METRLIRQELLSEDKPLKLAGMLDESVLHRTVGDRSLMHAQLRRLMNVSELPDITIQILPLNRSQRLAVESFAILRFANELEAALHDVVSTEHLSGESYVEGETDTYQYHFAFHRARLRRQARPPRQSPGRRNGRSPR